MGVSVGSALVRVAGLALAAAALYYSMREAYSIRMYAVNTYGRVIHEFDPWFNYRAAHYLSKHGWRAFFQWFDHRSWYPIGRPIGTTIYPGMQFTAVGLMRALNWAKRTLGLPTGISLNDTCVLLPAWFGCLASACVGLVAYESTGGSLASGVSAAAVMAVIPAHIMRSVAGCFDNEAVAVPAMCLTFWLWLLSLRGPRAWPLGAAAGLAYAYMAASWGGYVLAGNLVALHAAALVLLGRHSRALGRAYMLFWAVGASLASLVPVIGWAPFRSVEQAGPLVTFAAFVCLEGLALWRRRAGLSWSSDFARVFWAHAAVAGAAAAALAVAYEGGYFWPASIRVRSLFVEHTRTGNPLVDSVAEHQASSTQAYYQYLNVCLYALPAGAVLLLLRGLFDRERRTYGVQVTKYFLIIYTAVVYYFASRMSRLLLLMGPVGSAMAGVVVGAAVDYAVAQLRALWLVLTGRPEDYLIAPDDGDGAPAAAPKGKKAAKPSSRASKSQAPASYFAILQAQMWGSLRRAERAYRSWPALALRVGLAAWALVALYRQAVPFRELCHENARSYSQPEIMFQTTLSNGQTVIVRDYVEAYEWLRKKTPQDSRVLAWWDYGYHISGIANRTSIADGNTWNLEHIATIGRIMTAPEQKGWELARKIADYVLVWAGNHGDDLSKSGHLARIGSSVYDDMCPKGDDLCYSYTVDRDGNPTPMMERSMLYRMHSGGVNPKAKRVDPALFEEVYTSKFGLVRIYKIIGVDQEAKRWAADPANWVCDKPGGWYCPGQYPPGFPKPPKTHRNIRYN
eukprot:m51a1_g4506 putative oligosaccharyl transferase-like protein (795) ;mRNA; f:383402-386723